MLLGVVVILLLAALLAGCGKSGSRISAGKAFSPTGTTSSGGDVRAPSIVTPPDGFDVSELPERLQELFNQPIWNANIPVKQDWDAPEPPDPDPYLALERMREMEFRPRGLDDRSVSYYGDQEIGDFGKGTLTEDAAELSEMTGLGYAGDPGSDGRDDVIWDYGTSVIPPNAWTRVHLGHANGTLEQWRLTTEYAMFQIFGSEADQLVELSYGDIADPPGSHSAALVERHNYYRWNLETGLGEEGEADFVWYDQFIAPFEDEAVINNDGWLYEPVDAKNLTSGTVQYFDAVVTEGATGVDYPWSMFITMESTDYVSIQEDYIDPSAEALYTSRPPEVTEEEWTALKAQASVPVMGAIAELYRELNPADMDAPWQGVLGFPLEPMRDFNGGRPMFNTTDGIYRLFGQHFFHGFMWWYDFLLTNKNDWLYPYVYSGTTTYDADGEYVPFFPVKVEYGLNGPIACVGYADKYEVEPGQLVSYHAITWGGLESTAGDGLYGDVLWNFRDGTVGVGETVLHRFHQKARYVVRLIVINDDDADLPIKQPDDPDVAVFDLYRINVGTPGAAAAAGIALIVDEDGDTASQQDTSPATQATFDTLEVSYDIHVGDATVDDMLGYSSVFYANSLSTPTWFFNNDCADFGMNDAQEFASYVVDEGGNFVWFNSLMTYFPPNGFMMQGVQDAGFTQMIGGGSGAGTPPWSGWAGWGAHSLHQIQGSISGSYHAISQIQMNTSHGWAMLYEPCWYWAQYAGAVIPGGELVDVGPYPTGCISGMMNDSNDDDDGGYGLWIGVPYYAINQTSPDPGGKDALMENIINVIDPGLLPGGGKPRAGVLPEYAPYDGVFELLYVSAVTYGTDGTIEGGDGSLGRAGYDLYEDGFGTVRHLISAVPPDPGDVYLSVVAREGDQINDHVNWFFVVDWRDGERTPLLGIEKQDTYTLSHVYTIGIEPGVNAYTISGYAHNDPTAIYDGQGWDDDGDPLTPRVPDPLYPDLGEDEADVGQGAPTAIVVHAWNGTGSNTDWGTNAFIGGVLIGIDSTPPVQIYDISDDYGITYPDIDKETSQTFYWEFTGGVGGYEIWFDRDNDTPSDPELTFVPEVQATTANTEQNDGDVATPNWVAYDGTWTEGKDYRTTVDFPNVIDWAVPVGRVEDLGGGPIQYGYVAFPGFEVLATSIIEETCTGYTNWSDAASGPNAWVRGQTSSNSTRWYVGSQLTGGYNVGQVGAWTGPMFHCNYGTDGSNGSSKYNWPGSQYWILRSKQVEMPAGSSHFYYRVRCEGNDYRYYDYYCNFRGGWTTSSSTTSTSLNQYVYAGSGSGGWSYRSDASPFGPANVWYQTSLMHGSFSTGSPTNCYVKFWFKGSSWNWNGTGARGAHLDAIIWVPLTSDLPAGW